MLAIPRYIRSVVVLLCVGCKSISAVAISDSLIAISPSAAKKYIVNNITVSGNNRTKDKIILRELTIKPGDTIDQSNLDAEVLRSKNNVLNTSLFNFVRIDTIPFFENHIDIHIDVKERWYIFPVPIFEISERNFNTWLLNPNLARSNYGFYLIDENFRGLKENLSLKMRFGYAEQYELAYSIPFIDKKQTTGLGIGFSYNRNHEIAYSTLNDQLLYYKNPGIYVRDEWVGRLSYSRRSGLYRTQTADLRFIKSSVTDSVVSLTKDYFGGAEKIFQLVVASYGFRFDYRDSRVYPLKGYYFGVDLVKQGVGLKAETVNLLYAVASYRKYFQIYNRLYLGVMAKGKLSTYEKQPYYVQRALGYGDYVRGYELYVIDGQSYALFKANLRYQIIKPGVLRIKAIPTEKFNTIPYAFYFSVFSDAAYVGDNFYSKGNPLTNEWMLGSGLGIDFVTYYDNVVRVEYAWNRMSESGFYLHLIAPF